MSDMIEDNKIESSAVNWETGVLGSDEQFAKIAEDVTTVEIDQMLELQMISIRLQKGMIQDLKSIAKFHGLGGYQPLIRRVLERFIVAEMKSIARNSIDEKNQDNQNKAKEVIYSDDDSKIAMYG